VTGNKISHFSGQYSFLCASFVARYPLIRRGNDAMITSNTGESMLSRLAFHVALAAVLAAASAVRIDIASAAGRPAAAYTYTLVTEPTQGLTPIYNIITSAKKTIDMTMYELTDTQAEQLLAQAAAAGVTVRVILDQNLEKSNNQAAYTYLSENGVQVHWANPTYAATHQKTITVDDSTTAIMTLNLTSQYYSTSRDFAVIENDPNDISAIEQVFNADFENQAVTPPDGDDLVWSPTNSQTALLNLINSAEHSLLIENEEMSDTNIVNALASAASRGVLVQIAMTNDDNEYASEFNQLVAAGAEISTYAETASLYIHAKVILADYGSPDAQVFVGSENFSNASLTENRELGLIISNAAIMASIDTTLTSDFKGGTPWSGSKANFSVEANPSSLTVPAGSSGTATITTAVFDGFDAAVALSASGLPAGVTASFSPTSISAPGSGSSTLTLSANSSAAASTYAITVTGSGGGLKETASISLTISSSTTPGFSLSASPTSVTVAPGGSGKSTITAAISGGFSSAIALSAGGLPSGVTASFSPASIPAPGSGSSTLTLSAGSSTAAGGYTITITGTGGGLTETASITLTVTSSGTPGFALSASPASLTVAPGSSGTSSITAAISGGFDSAIALSASGLPSGVTASFSPASIPAPGSGSSTLTLSAGSSTVAGTYGVTIAGTGGGLTETTSVSVTISSSGSTQLITDGGFESATKSGLTAPGWTATTNISGHNVIVVNGPYPHSGKNYASLGGSNNENDTLTQTITVPAGTPSAPFTFWVNITTQETNGKSYDYLYVEIHNASGTLLATPLTLSNTNSSSDNNTLGVYFQPQSVDLSPYAGKTIEVVFHATTDYEKPTTFLIDDVSVTASGTARPRL
jgi:cardiolipin synthase